MKFLIDVFNPKKSKSNIEANGIDYLYIELGRIIKLMNKKSDIYVYGFSGDRYKCVFKFNSNMTFDNVNVVTGVSESFIHKNGEIFLTDEDNKNLLILKDLFFERLNFIDLMEII